MNLPPNFSPTRLRVARQRRALTAKALAERIQCAPSRITNFEKGHRDPDKTTINALAEALRYPVAFFEEDEVEELDAESVSFRGLSSMTARDRNAAIAAGSLCLLLIEWVQQHADLPGLNLIDLSEHQDDPETAAIHLRHHWGLGDRPLANLNAVLEKHGVRLLSLGSIAESVNAFSFWKGSSAFIFLGQDKTAERSIFDSAHELGHLVLHHHAGPGSSREAEQQAHRFASAFLMPRSDVLARASDIRGAQGIIQGKFRWRVSAMALAHRMKVLGLLSEWSHRSIVIELGQLGYRRGEPQGIERESSIVWKKVLQALWSKRYDRQAIARELALPVEELDELVFGLLQSNNSTPPQSDRQLKVVS